MSDNGKQQGGPGNMGPIKVKSIHFFAPEGVCLSELRVCEGTVKEIRAGKHRKGWTTEIVREPWHRMYRVTETEAEPDGKWGKVRTVCIPESAASYVPLEVA